MVKLKFLKENMDIDVQLDDEDSRLVEDMGMMKDSYQYNSNVYRLLKNKSKSTYSRVVKFEKIGDRPFCILVAFFTKVLWDSL